MKVGVVTFQHANNYGALLQSYALQSAVKKYGYECDVIAYKSDYIEKPYSLSQLKRKGLFQYIVGSLGYVCYLPRKKACNRFRKLMTYSVKVDKDSVTELNNDYGIFITGSDQVWNYKLTGGDMNFLLKFVEDDRKKNSYAASIGINDIEPFMREAYKDNLQSFSCISVREKRAKEILEELGNIESTVVVDPTLLLEAKEWETMIEEEDSKEEYIVVYQLGISKRFVSYVKKISEAKGLKVKYIPFPLGSYVKSKWMLKAGPFEWLKLFKNAKYVITDSFHGVVFSLIFHRKFLVEVNERNKNVGGRIYELLSKVKLDDRIINLNPDLDIDTEIDFEVVDKVLAEQRAFSLKYLEKILKV